jgi:hypothetical protein
VNRFSSAPRVQFDVASTFDNETAIVKREDLWGVIDKEGKFIIRPQFFQIYGGNDFFTACLGDTFKSMKCGFISKKSLR